MFEERKVSKVPEKARQHNITIEGREKTSVSGVVDIDNFDESTVELYTDMGAVTIRGEDLHINKLNVETGELMIDGYIHNIAYSDKIQSSGGGLFKRLFK